MADLLIDPSPDWEQIEFFLPQGTNPQGTKIDAIYIHTVSPEPPTLSLVPLGACLLASGRKELALIRRRNR